MADNKENALPAAAETLWRTAGHGGKIYSTKALLLRLFQSELFTAVQALHYLQKYSNEPGIQYYLCERLKELPEQNVDILIPQLW
jgi:hypothetical protein